METRQLGTSDLQITPVVFGAWAIGGWMWGGTDEKDAIAAIHAAIDHGINIIDTAAIYGMGFSEELVAKALRGKKNNVLIATKCGRRAGAEVGDMPVDTKDVNGKPVTIRSDSRPESLYKECEESLRRLGVETIDLYQIHWPDTTFPLEESIQAMLRLKEQGKIRAIGVSNYNLEQLTRAHNTVRIDSIQPPYSAIRRATEETLLPYTLKENIGVICYSPMERGLLTGKVGMDRVFAPDDHRSTHKAFALENRKMILDGLEQIKPIAEQHNATLAQVIVAWTIAQKGITGAIVGARNAKQAEENAGAMSIKLSEIELRKIRSALDAAATEIGKTSALPIAPKAANAK